MAFENNHTLSGEVEIDETFVGGKNKNRHKDKRVEQCQGRSYKDKVPVFGILQRDGKLFVPNTQAKTNAPIIKKKVEHGSVVYTMVGTIVGYTGNTYRGQLTTVSISMG